MFGFGKVPCVLCDQQVARKHALKVLGQKGFAVCRACLEQWRALGGTCPECHAALRGAQEPGLFLRERRVFGHADCGAARLVAA
jgi:hypothetical protein